MPASLPLFPLGTVLFPGMVLPLHVFEERYRELFRRLQDQPEGTAQEFGVVPIREGWEVGVGGARAVYPHGCRAVLRIIEAHEDGTYDIVAVGTERFRLRTVNAVDDPYYTGVVTPLEELTGDADEALVVAGSVRRLYHDYLTAMGRLQGLSMEVPELPDDPLELSHLVGATAPLELADRHALLAAPDAEARLRSELHLLRRELTMLQRLHVVTISLAQLAVPRSRN